MRSVIRLAWIVVVGSCALVGSACAGKEAAAPATVAISTTLGSATTSTSSSTSTTTARTTPTSSSSTSSTTSTTSTTSTSSTSSTTTSSTTPPETAPPTPTIVSPPTPTPTPTPTPAPPAPVVPSVPLDLTDASLEIGYSVEGRPIIAERSGELGGRKVLVIGVIHGDEDAGVAIVDQLRAQPAPAGVELWTIESMNPDGQAILDRHNANQVDLNRNFPYNWGPLGQPGDGQYAGVGPASEPETQAMVNFITQLRPDIAIWYHQDLYVISPSSGRDGRIRARYAELTGLPLGEITGGTYTGIAATWARRELEPGGSVAFIVELGESLSPEEAELHASAVRTIAVEG